MAKIERKDGKEFCCKTKTYKKVDCIIKSGERVTVDFDRLFITGTGEVRALIIETGEYASLRQFIPRHLEDCLYFKFMAEEFRKISSKFQKERGKKPRYKKI